MASNSELINTVHNYISNGHIPSKTHRLYPAFMDWKKKWDKEHG